MNPEVQRELDGIRETARRVKELDAVVDDLRDYAGGCGLVVDRVSVPWGSCTKIYAIEWIMVDREFAEVAPLRRALRGLGYRLVDKARTIHELRAACWEYARDGAAGTELELLVQLPYSSEDDPSSCRFVQVGTREVPLYEVRCLMRRALLGGAV